MAPVYICRMHMPDSAFSSMRRIASFHGCSHTRLYDLMAEFPDRHHESVIGGSERIRGRGRAVCKRIRVHTMEPDVRKIIKRRDRGPQKGYPGPGTELSADAVAAVRKQHPGLGAAEINMMAGSSVSAPAARKMLHLAGYAPVTMRRGRKYRRFEREHVDGMRRMEYVRIGWDSVTGHAVESLSAFDGRSRTMLTADAGITAAADDAVRILEEAIAASSDGGPGAVGDGRTVRGS